MNEHRDGSPRCYFHPREVVVGICALCLRERLVILASKQGIDASVPKSTSHQRSFRAMAVKSTSIVIPRVFALSSFLHRPESWRHRRKFDDSDQEDSIPSLEDSFISIKFDDGGASWDKKTAAYSNPKSNLPLDGKGEGGGKSVVEHRGGLRWRKRVGHLFQVLRWKRSSKAKNSCHTAAEAAAVAAKGRRGWMRSLTRRRTTAAADLPVED